MRILVLGPIYIVPYTSPPEDLVLILYGPPEVSASVDDPNVVAEPPTLFVNAPATASVVPGFTVRLAAALMVVLLVEVALLVMVQPPEEESNRRL